MSVERRGREWRVRWWAGGRQHSRQFARKADAQAFDLELRRRRQLGPLAASVLISQTTLAEFWRSEWLPKYAAPNLRESTVRRYAEVWATHLLPRIGGYELREITPALVQDLVAQLHATGLAPASQRKALLLLQGILRHAAVRGLIPSNPVAVVDKPRTPPQARRQPLSPATVEAVRTRLGHRDAILVSVLAYAGLRPGEATSARWGDLGERTLHVEASKTEKARDVKLLVPLAQDLAEWRLASGRPDDRALIFPREQLAQSRRRRTSEWTREDWNNWRRRIYRPVAVAAGVTGDLRPYRLRCSFASLLLWEGRSLAYVADQDGHSIKTLAEHYAGLIEELEDKPRVPAAEAIRQARASVWCAPLVPKEARRR